MQKKRTKMSIGNRNISFGWLWILIGIIAGAIMGMWSFNGPLTSPLGEYTALPRRMVRLAHIAFIALAIINILYGYEIDKIKSKFKNLGSQFMIYGAILMPLFLIAAAFFEPLKYLTVIPATLVTIALLIMVFGRFRSLYIPLK